MMKKILITGALGQIGSELVMHARNIYGNDNVIATDIRKTDSAVVHSGPFEVLDVTDPQAMASITKNIRQIPLSTLQPCSLPQQKQSLCSHGT